jgi:hypothetical protein
MHKKQVIESIMLLARALNKDVVTKDLGVDALTALHEKLLVEKCTQDEALSMISDQGALSTQAKVVLTFIAPHKRYSNGDVAGFDADVAKSILALKPPVAKAYEKEKEADNAAEK